MVSNNPIHVGEYIEKEVKDISFFSKNTTGLSTGFVELDNRVSLLNPTELTVIASRPSMGKTALSIDITLHCAIYEQVPTLFFCFGYSKKMLVKRLLCSMAHVASQDIRNGTISKDNKARIEKAINDLSKSKLFIDDTSVLTVSDIYQKCCDLRDNHGLGIIVIDGIQEIKHDINKVEIEEMVVELKSMSLDLCVPIIVTSQINRLCEKRSNHRPRLATDFGDYGVLANVADNVVFLYRDEYYKPNTKNLGVCELIIAKSKDGTGTICLKFVHDYVKFCNMEYAD